MLGRSLVSADLIGCITAALFAAGIAASLFERQ
jgi:hypothetical protein